MNRISESMHVAKIGEVRLKEPDGSSSLFDDPTAKSIG